MLTPGLPNPEKRDNCCDSSDALIADSGLLSSRYRPAYRRPLRRHGAAALSVTGI